MKSLAIFVATLALGISAMAANCPSKPQKIRVIDLKSGWWQGDGMDTDSYVIKHLEINCPNVKVYYEHQLYGGFGPHGTGPTPNVEPDQVWLLSGSELDSADLPLGSPAFKRYLDLIVTGKANVFLGTGFGNVVHANAVTEGLGLGKLLVALHSTAEYPNPTTVATVSELPLAQLDCTHPLFKDLTALPDIMNVGGFVAPNDQIVTNQNVRVLAKTAEGATLIGEANLGSRKVIIDANLARTYQIRNGDENIKKYLLNLTAALED